MTPLQDEVRKLIAAYERRRGQKFSGREIADRLGKSRNLISQILNDGLVPSGELLERLAELLGASEAERDALILAAIRTKAASRSRDSFWLEQALALLDQMGEMRRFLAEEGQDEAFRRWLDERGTP